MTYKKKAGLGIFLVFALLALWLVGWHLHLRHQVSRYKSNLLAQGEFLSVTQAWPRTLTGEPQKAAAFSLAVNKLTMGRMQTQNQVPMMRTVAFGRALAGSQLPEIKDYYTDKTNTWADVLEEVNDNREALTALRQSLTGASLDFNLDYSQGFNLLIPYLAKAKQAAQAVWMATALALHNRELVQASTNLITLLSLSQALQHDRIIICELVQIAIAHLSAAATWEALQTPGWSDSQLKELEDKWLSLKFAGPMQDCLAMERAMNIDTMERLRGSSQKFSTVVSPMPGGMAAAPPAGSGPRTMLDFLEGASGSIKAMVTHTLWHYFWSYEDELRCLQISQVHLAAMRQTNSSWVSTDALIERQLSSLGIKLLATNEDDHEFFDTKALRAKTFFSDNVLGTKNCIKRAMSAETVKQIAATAIALKRFQLRNGKYPPGLSALVPDFLPQLPTDHMIGKPLLYRLESDGTFTLYSVGLDGIDQGAVPPPKSDKPRGWTLERDWIWPSLASPEEIRDYQAQQVEKNQKRVIRRKPSTPASTNSVK